MAYWVRSSSPYARKIEAAGIAAQAALQAKEAPPPAVLQPEKPSAPPRAVSVKPCPFLTVADPMPLEQPRAATVPWRVIAREVASRRGIGLPALLGENRARRFSVPRQEVMYLLVEQGMSFAAVGRRFKRDHSTVLHAVRRHAERHGLPRLDSAHGFSGTRPQDMLALPAESAVL